MASLQQFLKTFIALEFFMKLPRIKPVTRCSHYPAFHQPLPGVGTYDASDPYISAPQFPSVLPFNFNLL